MSIWVGINDRKKIFAQLNRPNLAFLFASHSLVAYFFRSHFSVCFYDRFAGLQLGRKKLFVFSSHFETMMQQQEQAKYCHLPITYCLLHSSLTCVFKWEKWLPKMGKQMRSKLKVAFNFRGNLNLHSFHSLDIAGNQRALIFINEFKWSLINFLQSKHWQSKRIMIHEDPNNIYSRFSLNYYKIIRPHFTRPDCVQPVLFFGGTSNW